MRSRFAAHLSLIALASLITADIAAQNLDIPVRNWTVPPYRSSSSSGSLSPMADISQAVGFTAITPCRVVDTRNAPGPYGGPALATNAVRAFDINSGPCTGIPTIVDAYSLSIGGILAPADGFLSAWPTGTSQPLISQLNLIAGEVVANAAIVPAGPGGSINVLVNIGPTNVYIDINGYFSRSQNSGQSLYATSTNVSAAIIGENSSTSDNAIAIFGAITPAAPGNASAGVYGINYGTGSLGWGVVGVHSGDGTGVRGAAVGAGFGVFGFSTNGVGVQGSSSEGRGVVGVTTGTSAQDAGVVGSAVSASGATYGGLFINQSDTQDSAGVLGVGDLPPVNVGVINYGKAGVRGESGGGFGALGISDTTAVAGVLINGSGAIIAQGRLGASIGTDPSGGSPPWSFFGNLGDIGGVGVKAFVEPHRTDPSKVIEYIALEGPEAGTYFRGRARFQRGLARIAVPEDFRMVTDPEGLTVQVTPIGGMATVGVLKMGLDEIVVQSSRDLEFSYHVHGVRSAYRDHNPIRTLGVFTPESPDARIPLLVEGHRRALVQNGTYNADGTVNMETARRLGWEKVWEEKGRPTPQGEPQP